MATATRAIPGAITGASACGTHLGRARTQNGAGHLLGHVRDVGRDPTDPNTRIYQTNRRQNYHTDSVDIPIFTWIA